VLSSAKPGQDRPAPSRQRNAREERHAADRPPNERPNSDNSDSIMHIATRNRLFGDHVANLEGILYVPEPLTSLAGVRLTIEDAPAYQMLIVPSLRPGAVTGVPGLSVGWCEEAAALGRRLLAQRLAKAVDNL
jgi:hypothetical protein